MGKVGLISYPDSGPIGRLKDLFANFAGSVNQALPVKFVTSLAALNALSLDPNSLPAGTMAILTADDHGLAAGAEFTMHPAGEWRLIGTCTALDINTFVAYIATLPRVRVQIGALAWNLTSSTLHVFIATNGAHDDVTTLKMISDTGTLPANIAINTTWSTQITFPPGTFATVPSNILVTANNSRLNCAAVTRTKDGFTLGLSNWSNGALGKGVRYWWTAWA